MVVTGIGLVTCLGVGKDFVWRKLIQGCCGITKVRGQGKVYPLLAGIGLVTCLCVGKDFVWSRLIQGCFGIIKVRETHVGRYWAGNMSLSGCRQRFCLVETHSGLLWNYEGQGQGEVNPMLAGVGLVACLDEAKYCV